MSDTPQPSIVDFIPTPANDKSPTRISEELLNENITELSKSALGGSADLAALGDSRFFFTPIAAKPVAAVGSSPQDITRVNLDKSDILLDAIQQCRGHGVCFSYNSIYLT